MSGFFGFLLIQGCLVKHGIRCLFRTVRGGFLMGKPSERRACFWQEVHGDERIETLAEKEMSSDAGGCT